MEEYRLLILSNDSGSKETVVFLDADETDSAELYCKPGQSVSFDEIIEADLPAIFPINNELNRS